jgi:gamma-glutamylcyclotransferase (GGCT)/AIG2-like uncharacterized protein YtfP
VTNLVFFYGTLMSGFKRPGRARIDSMLAPLGRGFIRAALFDMGLYPAAVPAADAQVTGELHQMIDSDAVLHELDEIEGFRPEEPDTSLYLRAETAVTLEDGRTEMAWTYFYNAPLGGASRIESGDYLDYLKVRR